LKRALLEKGFREESGHQKKGHTYFRLYVGEKKTHVLTQVSEGKANRNLASPNVKRTYKQMHISKDQLFAFVDCSMSEADYVAAAEQSLAEQGREL